MIPIGSSSSRTKGRLVMEKAFPVVGCCVAGQNACRTPHPATPYPTTGNGNGRVGLGSLRHVQRRVQLTLGLRCRETGARLPAAAAHDLPTTVLGLQRFRGERDHLVAEGLGRITCTPPGRVRTCNSASSVWRSRGRDGARAAGT